MMVVSARTAVIRDLLGTYQQLEKVAMRDANRSKHWRDHANKCTKLREAIELIAADHDINPDGSIRE